MTLWYIDISVRKYGFCRDNTELKCLFCNQAFRKAWETACSSSNSVLLVPKEGRYLVNATKFKGPCKHGMVIQVSHRIIRILFPQTYKEGRSWLKVKS